MKSALLAAIFGIIGGVAMLLAAVPVVKIHPEWKWDGDAPLVPQIEEEVPVPEPLDHYSVAQAKTKIEKQAPPQVCGPPSKLLREITCQFHQPPKTSAGEIIS
jgi:hypothetical protein